MDNGCKHVIVSLCDILWVDGGRESNRGYIQYNAPEAGLIFRMQNLLMLQIVAERENNLLQLQWNNLMHLGFLCKVWECIGKKLSLKGRGVEELNESSVIFITVVFSFFKERIDLISKI